jgi:hypothetical protein
MTLTHDHLSPSGAEAGVRTMLHRLAAGATTCPPAWEDLVSRDEAQDTEEAQEAQVLPLGIAGSTAETAVRRRRTESRPRILLRAAAAALLVVAAGGALVAHRAGSGPATDRPLAEPISAVSPGDPDFDASTAPAVWATGQSDPVAATLAYLAAMGVSAGATPPAATLRGTAGATAAVDWSFGAGGSRGTVYLRSSATAGTSPTWTIVGSSASDIALGDLRYDGSRLSFTVTRTNDGPEQVAVGAWIDGQPVSLGGRPVAWAGSGGVSLGDLVQLGTAADAARTLWLAAAPDDIVTLRVARVVDGTVRSLTQMTVALPDAAPALAATGVPPVDVAGNATGSTSAGAGVDGGAGGASAEGQAGGSGGTDLTPGGTVSVPPVLPPLPVPLPDLVDPGAPAPTIPTVPGVPAPTLPPPPSTVGLG